MPPRRQKKKKKVYQGKPTTRAGMRAVKQRQPQVNENAKKVLIFRGPKTNEVLLEILHDFVSLVSALIFPSTTSRNLIPFILLEERIFNHLKNPPKWSFYARKTSALFIYVPRQLKNHLTDLYLEELLIGKFLINFLSKFQVFDLCKKSILPNHMCSDLDLAFSSKARRFQLILLWPL